MGTTFQTLSPAEALHRLFSGAVVGRMQVAPEAIDSRLHLPTGTAAYVSTQPNPRRNEKFTAETLRQMTAYCRTLFAEFENELGATGVAEILPFAIPDSISSPAVTRMTAKGLALFFAHTINGDDLQPELLKLLRKRVLDPEKGLRSEFQLFVDGIPRRGAESLNLGTPFRKIATIGPFTANPSMEALLRIAESNRPEKSAAAQIKTVTPPAAEKRDKPKQERLSLGKDEHYLLANLRNMQAQRMLKSGVNKFYVRLIEKMRTLREAPIQTVEDLRERMMTLPYWLAGREDIITRQLTVELIAHLRLKFVLPVRAASKASA
jgi:hypothetical protein